MATTEEVLVETRIDAAIHRKAGAVLASHGMTIDDAVRLLLTRTAATGEAVFSVDDEDTPVALEDEPEGYDAWFRAKVQEALDDPTPDIPDSEVRAYFARRREALRNRGNL